MHTFMAVHMELKSRSSKDSGLTSRSLMGIGPLVPCRYDGQRVAVGNMISDNDTWKNASSRGPIDMADLMVLL